MSNYQPVDLNIRPQVTIVSLFRYLNYKSWFAIAEFVDNSLQSFLNNKNKLYEIYGPGYVLRIDIDIYNYNGNEIVIRDNAGGIHTNDYQRAFRPASIPPDRTGLAEFGVGMKSAACWFGNQWSVRTSALGEAIEGYIYFDIDDIVVNTREIISPRLTLAKSSDHFTEITIRELHHPLKGRTISKIKDHLASIYRYFIRDGSLELYFRGEILTYNEPEILNAPYYKDEGGTPVEWKKEIDFDLGLGLRAHGFAAIREKASTSDAGFSLFRRKRLIQGGVDEGYRPEEIFKYPNSFIYQRLFGELHLEGFEVSHTKDGFRWGENEDTFLQLLEEHLDSEPLPLLDQAENRRVRPKPKDMQRGGETALTTTAKVLQENAAPVLDEHIQPSLEDTVLPPVLPTVLTPTERTIEIRVENTYWTITIELTTDLSESKWLNISDVNDTSSNKRQLRIRVSLVHPFMEKFAGAESAQIEPLLRIASGLALAEITAREAGIKDAAAIRRRLNDLLRRVLAKV